MVELTPSQTIGPYFAIAFPATEGAWHALVGNNLVTPDVAGERIRIAGRVLDAAGKPINDALLEIWQADAVGRYAHPADGGLLRNVAFAGFGRTGTDDDGAYHFDTIKPGAVLGPDGKRQAPHIVMAVHARGMLRQLYTRIYFVDEALNESDLVLGLVPAERRRTLIARRGGNAGLYGFDVHLAGEDETVFFDV